MKSRVSTYIVFLFLGVIICCGFQPHKSWAAAPSSMDYTTQDDVFSSLEADLESIRQVLKIPGMSVAVVQDQELVWASGFGYADMEQRIKAASETPYGLASVTKPVAAVLIMQLVEDGFIELDAPVSAYGVTQLGSDVTVRHLMTHTSEGTPGVEFYYNGNRYGMLGGVIEGATGRTFAELLTERISKPLEMNATALNPISSWGGSSASLYKDFQLALGLGDTFRHYPVVYAQLAQPYQLNEAYDLVPGMYHLYHNPAAGLISSAVDLAKFDIALDQGVLLGEGAKAEMFSPAFSTYENRTDLMYGLGWYVQEFEGLRLLWHTGRWPPSTSALYLKIPDENLTFIVLANTDNLTVPFNGLGHGDVSKSLLALSFFRHMIFPEHFGAELPDVDWNEVEGKLVKKLTAVEGEPARRFLERELWAYRQAFASVGDANRVNVLWRVSQRAFHGSEMRRDLLFTQTAGKPQVIPPSISSSTFTKLSWGVLTWFMMVCGSLVWMGATLWRSGKPARGWWFAWLMSTLFLGPLAALAHTLSKFQTDGSPQSRRQIALSVSALIISGYAIGWAIAFTLLKRLGGNPHPLAILGLTYLIPLSVTFAFYQLPHLVSRKKEFLKSGLPGALLAGVISNNISFAMMFPLTMVFNNRILTTVPGSFSLFSWWMLSMISLVNLGAQFLVHYWDVHLSAWNWQIEPSGSQSLGPLRPLKKSWFPILLSLFILVISLAITITQLA